MIQNRQNTHSKRERQFKPRVAKASDQFTDSSSRGEGIINFPKMPGKVRLIPLGGLGEYGKNMMVYEYEDQFLIVDCGIMFPEEEMLGIDFVIPDVRFLEQNKDKILGMVFTHGHEDHIGGVPYIWSKLGCKMFGSNLTVGLIQVKLEEFGIKGTQIGVVKAGEKLKLGPFELEFFNLAHSIPDTLGLCINTPNGRILHVTDWKFDHTPISGMQTDAAKLAEYGKEGVLALLSDSSNIEKDGYTISERVVSEVFDKIFKDAKGRVIVTCFASLINRIQQVINTSVKYHRKVAISGRSMQKNIEATIKLGHLKVPEGIIVDINDLNKLPDEQGAILCTGSQGEEYSALSRIAAGEHRQIRIKRGDTVVISASPIPGNESSISETINSLFRQGADVIYGKQVDIHVSGHASREELKMLLTLVNPKYFVPVHGEYRHLKLHARLAQQMGWDERNTFVIEDGQVIEFTKKGEGFVAPYHIPNSYVMVDGLGVGDVGNIVLRDRQAMAEEGIFVVILTIDHGTGQIVTSPDIISRGFVYMRAAEDLIHASRQEIKRMFDCHNKEYPMNWSYIKQAIRDDLGKFLFDKTQRRPMVIPVIIEV